MTRDPDKLAAVIRLAIDMRGAQKHYFRTRDHNDLVAAKRCEKDFDRAVDEVSKDDGRLPL